MKYYYLGKETSWNRYAYPIPNEHFRAVRVKNQRTGEITFVPIVQTVREKERKEKMFFYNGFGWIRLSGRKIYEIPLYDGEPAGWKKYIEQYGRFCLYYSINGKMINNDCCDFREIQEFFSICNSDAEKYPAFVDAYLQMNEIQERIINETFEGKRLLTSERDKLFFRPCYSIMGFAFPFSVDVITDDGRLEAFWRAYRAKDLSWPACVAKDFVEQVDREIGTENEVFPTCMSERIKMIYGSECDRIYEGVLKLVS